MIQYKTSSICIFESELFRTTATVLQTPDLVLVVDPNWLPSEVIAIQQFVQNIRADKPLYLLFTHSDYDHIIGYRAFPDAKVIASQAFADKPDKAEKLQQTRAWDEARYIRRSYPIEYPEVDIVITKDAQLLTIGSTQFTFYLAPGHTADGIFTIIEFANECIWIAGDYLSNIEFPFMYHSSIAYEETLRTAKHIIEKHHPPLLIPGHGDITTHQQDMQKRIKESETYIQDLRQAIQMQTVFPLDKLWQRYIFPAGMQKDHDGNVELMQKELS